MDVTGCGFELEKRKIFQGREERKKEGIKWRGGKIKEKVFEKNRKTRNF